MAERSNGVPTAELAPPGVEDVTIENKNQLLARSAVFGPKALRDPGNWPAAALADRRRTDARIPSGWRAMTGAKKCRSTKYLMLRALPPLAPTENYGSPFKGSLSVPEMLLPRLRQVKIRSALFMQKKCNVDGKVTQ